MAFLEKKKKLQKFLYRLQCKKDKLLKWKINSRAYPNDEQRVSADTCSNGCHKGSPRKMMLN